MSLRERLGQNSPLKLVSSESGGNEARETALQDLKGRVHYKVIDQMDLSLLGENPAAETERELETVIRAVVDAEPDPLSQGERDNLVREIKNEVLGLGPLFT